jgi:hypothetical protein
MTNLTDHHQAKERTRMFDDESLDRHGSGLTNAMDTVNGLSFNSRRPPRIHLHSCRRDIAYAYE